MHPRYFIGIALPEKFAQQLAAIQKDLLKQDLVMPPLVPHITLLHPNILMTLSPIYFLPQVKNAASEHLPIEIELTKTAMFDKRVLYIHVKSSGIVKLQSELVALLPDEIRARYMVGRDFTPHVTIAQAKPLQQLDDILISKLEERLTPLLPVVFKTNQLTTFTSEGPRKYKIEDI